jgi:hypothetical protein
MIDELVARYREEPRRKRSRTVIGLPLGVKRQQGFLHKIFHIGSSRIGHAPTVIGDQQSPQGMEQMPVGGFVPIKGTQHQHFQCFFRGAASHRHYRVIRKSAGYCYIVALKKSRPNLSSQTREDVTTGWSHPNGQS